MPPWRWDSPPLQTYRYVILPLAFRIILPPLTSETMNLLLKNSSVAFAVSIAELTMFAMQAQEETSRGVEIYLAVTACCTPCQRFTVNRLMALAGAAGSNSRLHAVATAVRAEGADMGGARPGIFQLGCH
jgi:ABC-type arginine transport system permease subunit